MSGELQALVGGRVFDGDRIVEGQAVLIADGRIEALVPEGEIPPNAERVALEGGLLTPGFIDVQVNGGGGIMLNDSPTVDGVRMMAEAHRRFGTTGMLPTLITDTPEKMPAAIEAVRRAMAEGVPGVLGIHLEGPFLNVERKGVHDPRLIRPITEADIATATSLETGKTLVTLAPERAPEGTVRRLSDAGVLVCAGHTVGPYDAIRAAIAEGLRGFTHLFNAMEPMNSREPGVVGAALDDPGTWCGVIVDGHHVHPASLRVALAAKPRGRMMLVTDAMAPVGAAEPSFVLKGETITAIGGRCATEDGTLAGSALDMASAVRNSVAWLGQTVEEALRMASLYPAAFLGLDDRLGRIAPFYHADLVLLDDDLAVRRTWIGGVAG